MLRLLAVLLPVESLVMVGIWVLLVTLIIGYFSVPTASLPGAVQDGVVGEFQQAVRSFPATPNGERVLVLPFANDHTGQATDLFRTQLLEADKVAVIQPGLLSDAKAHFGFRASAPHSLAQAQDMARTADTEWAVWGKVKALPGSGSTPRLELVGFDARNDTLIWGYRSDARTGAHADSQAGRNPADTGSAPGAVVGVIAGMLGQLLFTLAFLPVGRRIVRRQSNLANALLLGLHGIVGFTLAIAGAWIAGAWIASPGGFLWLGGALLALAGTGAAAGLYARIADRER